MNRLERLAVSAPPRVSIRQRRSGWFMIAVTTDTDLHETCRTSIGPFAEKKDAEASAESFRHPERLASLENQAGENNA